MADGLLLVALFVGLPLGLAALLGVVQGVLTAYLRGDILRALLVGLLPGVSALTALYTRLRLWSVTGWDRLEWGIYWIWALSALAGTLLGWLFGGLYRRARQGAGATDCHDGP